MHTIYIFILHHNETKKNPFIIPLNKIQILLFEYELKDV